MRMCSESVPGGDAVFIDNVQGPESLVLRIVVAIERERVMRVEPAVIEVSTFIPVTYFDHDYSRSHDVVTIVSPASLQSREEE